MKHEKKPSVIVAFGTRPELIKMAPVIQKIGKSDLRNEFLIVNTAQHEELLKDQLEFWDINPDVTFKKGEKDSDLTRLFARSLIQLQDLLDIFPSVKYVLVQGDTNTALACANFAFLNHLKLIHIEAGLRTFDMRNPFPEEFNRVTTSKVAWLHFVHSQVSYQNLIAEGIPAERIVTSGNTVIDALRLAGVDMANHGDIHLKNEIVVTMHRRENADRILNLVSIIESLHKRHPFLKFKWVMHPNYPPKVLDRIRLNGHLVFSRPMTYQKFISLYNKARVVITDSGGVTEEASQLGIPIVVFRNKSERIEPLQSGHPMIVTLDESTICNFFQKALDETCHPHNYYGNGNASEIIFSRIKQELGYD